MKHHIYNFINLLKKFPEQTLIVTLPSFTFEMKNRRVTGNYQRVISTLLLLLQETGHIPANVRRIVSPTNAIISAFIVTFDDILRLSKKDVELCYNTCSVTGLPLPIEPGVSFE